MQPRPQGAFPWLWGQVARDGVNGERRLSISPLPPPGRKAGKWNLILPVATPFGHVLEGSFHPEGGVLDISLGGEVRPGLSYPNPV